MKERYACIHLSENWTYWALSEDIAHNLERLFRETPPTNFLRIDEAGGNYRHYSHASEVSRAKMITGNKDHEVAKTVIFKALDEIKSAVDNLNEGIEAENERTYVTRIVIGCFGPFVSLNDEDQENYGALPNISSHNDWKGANIFKIARSYSGFKETKFIVKQDVDLTALGEFWRVNPDKTKSEVEDSVAVFLKISRSVNGATVYGGKLWRGRHHPLMSVLKPRYYRIEADDEVHFDGFEGACDVHGDCIEGLIGVKALEKRAGKILEDFDENENYIWELVAHYVARMCVIVTGVLAPEFIVLGGRVIEDRDDELKAKLLSRIRTRFYQEISTKGGGEMRLSPDYPELRDPENFIRPRSYELSGVYGGLFAALEDRERERVKRG